MFEMTVDEASGKHTIKASDARARLNLPRVLLGGVLLGLALVSSAMALLSAALPLNAAAAPRVSWRFEIGPQSSCVWNSASPADGALLCPQGYGAYQGVCEDGLSGQLLVTGRGTGWFCAPRSSVAASRVSMMCCR